MAERKRIKENLKRLKERWNKYQQHEVLGRFLIAIGIIFIILLLSFIFDELQNISSLLLGLWFYSFCLVQVFWGIKYNVIFVLGLPVGKEVYKNKEPKHFLVGLIIYILLVIIFSYLFLGIILSRLGIFSLPGLPI